MRQTFPYSKLQIFKRTSTYSFRTWQNQTKGFKLPFFHPKRQLFEPSKTSFHNLSLSNTKTLQQNHKFNWYVDCLSRPRSCVTNSKRSAILIFCKSDGTLVCVKDVIMIHLRNGFFNEINSLGQIWVSQKTVNCYLRDVAKVWLLIVNSIWYFKLKS